MKKEVNPFEQPNILDRNIEKFNDCTLCGKEFCTADGDITVPFKTVKLEDEIITIITCSLCNREFKFRNWKK